MISWYFTTLPWQVTQHGSSGVPHEIEMTFMDAPGNTATCFFKLIIHDDQACRPDRVANTAHQGTLYCAYMIHILKYDVAY